MKEIWFLQDALSIAIWTFICISTNLYAISSLTSKFKYSYNKLIKQKIKKLSKSGSDGKLSQNQKAIDAIYTFAILIIFSKLNSTAQRLLNGIPLI